MGGFWGDNVHKWLMLGASWELGMLVGQFLRKLSVLESDVWLEMEVGHHS